MGIATTPQKSVGSPSASTKDAHAMKGRKDPAAARRIIDEKIATALDCQEKKDLNKFEALSILSDSNKDDDSNSDSRVSNTSNEDMNLE
eukprot:13534901-Ditylum_brightwellii.AAC.1